MTTQPPTSPTGRGPVDQPLPVGHWPPRRTLPPDLAASLWTARQESGMTNRDAAEQIGVDPSYLSKLVRGNRCPSSLVAERLIDVLAMSAGEAATLRDAAVTDRGKSRPFR
jgi:ribosome-binding protein aMBF1 (putative translation factor)